MIVDITKGELGMKKEGRKKEGRKKEGIKKKWRSVRLMLRGDMLLRKYNKINQTNCEATCFSN